MKDNLSIQKARKDEIQIRVKSTGNKLLHETIKKKVAETNMTFRRGRSIKKSFIHVKDLDAQTVS